MTCEINAADLAGSVRTKSDQLNADDLISGALTGRIVRITKGATLEQPVNVQLSCWHVPWRPCKTERRVLIALWGEDPAAWMGRTLRIQRDAMVAFGGENVGGVRIAGASHIKGEVSVMLNKSKGKKARRTVVEIPAADVATETRTIHPNVQRLADGLASNGWLDDAVRQIGRKPIDWTPEDFNAAKAFGVARKEEIDAAALRAAAESAAFGESGGEE